MLNRVRTFGRAPTVPVGQSVYQNFVKDVGKHALEKGHVASSDLYGVTDFVELLEGADKPECLCCSCMRSQNIQMVTK